MYKIKLGREFGPNSVMSPMWIHNRIKLFIVLILNYFTYSFYLNTLLR